MTNELYDAEVDLKPYKAWLLVFTKGIFSENPYDTMAGLNERLSESLLELVKRPEAKGIKIGYVDIH